MYKVEVETANASFSIEEAPSAFYKSSEISEKEALDLLWKEVDPMGNYPITDYVLIKNSYGRYGITYA